MKQTKHNQRGFGVVEVIIIVVIVGALAGVTGLVLHDRQKNNAATTPAVQTSPTEVKRDVKPEDLNVKLPSGIVEASNKQIPAAGTGSESELEKNRKTEFVYADTAGWKDYSPKGGAFTIKFTQGISYGYCNNSQNTFLLGLIFLDQNGGGYDCDGVKTAITWQPFQGRSDARVLYTRIAFGPAQTLWDRGDAKGVTVTLANGTTAERFEYTNTLDRGVFDEGPIYHTIEYITTQKSGTYTAVMHWADNLSPSRTTTGATIPDFDTIVQKTWSF